MKTTIEGTHVFQPVHIILETPEEVAKFHALFNYCPVIEALEIVPLVRESRHVMEQQGYPKDQSVWFDKLQNNLIKTHKRV
jgi:hypothetical protein